MPSAAFHAHQARVARESEGRPVPHDLAGERAAADLALGSLPLAEGVEAAEVAPGGVPAIELRPPDAAGAPLLVYFHGGGYRLGSAVAWRAYGSQIAARGRLRVCLVDYRLAPEHPFPAALEDAVAAWRGLLDAGEEPSRMAVGGDSAGGGLAAALCPRLRDLDLPLPAGCVSLSPWTDLTLRAETYRSNAASDTVFSLERARAAAEAYLQGADATDPGASPLYADWKGLPPLLIQVGDVEVLLDDARGLAARARRDGVEVELSEYPGMPHVWQMACPAFPEAAHAVDAVGAFVRARTGAG